MSAAALRYSLELNTSAFTSSLRSAMGAAKGLVSGLASLGNIVTGIASLPGAFQTLTAPLRQPISLAADMETLQTAFKALLKDGAAAKRMAADLMQFADATPFDPVPVAQAGKQLLAFGFAAKDIKGLLTDIGDLAASFGADIADVASVFGRLGAGQFGEAFERLRAFGITLQDLVGQGLAFDKSGSFQGSAEQALEAVRQIIRRKFGGGMQELSRTFSGLFSTFKGYWDQLQRTFGTPIMNALKPLLTEGTSMLQSWIPIAEEWGRRIGKAFLTLMELVKSGDIWQALSLGLQIAGKGFINILWRGLNGLIQATMTGLAEAAGILQTLLSQSGLWEGIGAKLQSIFASIRASIMEAMAAVVEALPGWLGGGKDAAMGLYASAADADLVAKAYDDEARAAFASIDWQAIVSRMAEGFTGTAQAFTRGFTQNGDVMSTSGDLAELEQLIAPAMAKAEAFFSTSQAAEQANTQAIQATNATVKEISYIFSQYGQVIGTHLKTISEELKDSGRTATF